MSSQTSALKDLLNWVTDDDRNYAAHGLSVTALIVPASYEDTFNGILKTHPLPATESLRIDKSAAGRAVVVLKGRPVRFSKSITKTCMFRLKETLQ